MRSYRRKHNMNNDPSFGALLFGIDPDEQYNSTCYNLTVNYNDSNNNKVEVLRMFYNSSGSKTPLQSQNEHLQAQEMCSAKPK